ncbi:MAG: helix-turn-helix transcriptional regulator [Anaerolineae bacterium]|nr:helix-turn-helix transcriptional regulator [Gemmatimonadaceae bacterium]
MHVSAPSSPGIKSLRQIRALASADRQDIVDALESAGPCSVRELATLLGRRPDALYYHIRVLREVGLLSQSSPEENGERGAVVDLLFRPLHLVYELGDRANREGVCRVVGAMARSAQRDFRRAFRPGVAQVEGPARDLWAARCQGWLSDEDMHEVNRMLSRVLSILRARQAPTRTGAKRREITFILAPLPSRRSSKSS